MHGSRGLYTFVFDDVDYSQLLAFFTPMGKACCYYRNGAIHMLSDRKGGCLYSEVRQGGREGEKGWRGRGKERGRERGREGEG